MIWYDQNIRFGTVQYRNGNKIVGTKGPCCESGAPGLHSSPLKNFSIAPDFLQMVKPLITMGSWNGSRQKATFSQTTMVTEMIEQLWGEIEGENNISLEFNWNRKCRNLHRWGGILPDPHNRADHLLELGGLLHWQIPSWQELEQSEQIHDQA